MATTQQMTQSGLLDVPRGMDLLDCPGLNKGTAFTEEERSTFGLHGLLPPHVESLEEQVVRAYEAYQRKDDDLERHIYLRALQDTNEVLFYRLLLDHIEDMTPMVYTPVVALACHNSVRSTGGRAAYSSHTRYATPFPRCCGIAPIQRSTSSS
jgi:malate dehydrogenase (oxaloacetate-decarboxylating)